MVYEPPTGFEEAFKSCPEGIWARRLSCIAMLSALGAPEFKPKPLEVVEDDVHWLIMHMWTKRFLKEMLVSTFSVDGVERLGALTAALRPRCKLPHVVLDVIFQLRSRVPVALRPLHCAVLLCSCSVVKKLLRISEAYSALKDYTTDDPLHRTVSPLFLAVLFADQAVVDTLRCHGACLNRVDAMATMRLQVAFLWADVEERLLQLQLGAEAEKLAKMADELRQQAARQDHM
jgi:hypothetical protein